MSQELLDRLKAVKTSTQTPVVLTKDNLAVLIDALQQSLHIDELVQMPDVSVEFQSVTPRDGTLRAITVWRGAGDRQQHVVRTGYSFTACLANLVKNAVKLGLRERKKPHGH